MKIAELLNENQDDLDGRSERLLQPIDINRKSRLAFIDGDRGTGKTSVLLTVQNLLQSDITALERYPSDVQKLYGQRKRFKCLETLDMEPLAPAANLLAAVFARILNVFEYPPEGGANRLGSPLDDLDESEKLADDLTRLAQSAVLAWEGTDPKRSRNVDPTIFASEVIASERAGTDLNRRLTKVLDSLSEALAGRRKDLIFILPVDDFDLAPGRCLELLRIVRTVSTPRLFFVIAGNIRIAEQVLRFQSEGEMAYLAGNLASGTEAMTIRRTAVEIAANNIRKLVPPGQRTPLYILAAKDARALTIKAGRTLDDELAGIRIDVNYACEGNRVISLQQQLLSTERYSGVAWLEGTPRQVLDRAKLLQKLQGDYSQNYCSDDYGKEILEAFIEEIERRIREDGHVAPESREVLLEVLDTSVSLKFYFSRRLTIESEIGSFREASSGKVRVRCKYPREHRWFIRGAEKQDVKLPAIELSRGVSGNLTFLHDLAISLWGGYVSESIIYESDWFYNPVSVYWGTIEAKNVSWFLPEWPSLREHERFVNCWEAYSNAKFGRTIDSYMIGWLRALLEVMLDLPHFTTPPAMLSADTGWPPLFDGLKDLLIQLVDEDPVRAVRKNLRKGALVNVALLLCPESGCSPSLAKEFVSQRCFLNKLGEDLLQRIRLHRAREFAVNREGSQADSLNVVELLAAISPLAASREIWGRRPSESRQQRKIVEQSGSKGAREELMLQIVRGGREAKDLTGNLKRLLNLLDEEDKEYRDWATMMLAVKETPFAEHVLNRYKSGVLVPSYEEVQACDISRRLP